MLFDLLMILFCACSEIIFLVSFLFILWLGYGPVSVLRTVVLFVRPRFLKNGPGWRAVGVFFFISICCGKIPMKFMSHTVLDECATCGNRWGNREIHKQGNFCKI